MTKSCSWQIQEFFSVILANPGLFSVRVVLCGIQWHSSPLAPFWHNMLCIFLRALHLSKIALILFLQVCTLHLSSIRSIFAFHSITHWYLKEFLNKVVLNLGW